MSLYTRRGRSGRRLAAGLTAGLSTLALAACSSSSPGSGASSAGAGSSSGQLTQVTIAYPSATTSETALWAGIEQGFFKKNGLDVTAEQVSASPALASLVKGQVQFADIGVAPALQAISQGLAIQIIATDSNMPTWDLVAGSNITSASQLKGKVVATGTQATLSDVVTRLALQKAGLDPGKDVQLELVGQTGSAPERTAALASGKVAAAVIDDGSLSQLASIHPHILLSYKALQSIKFAGGGVEASADYLSSHASTATAFLKAYSESIAWARNPANEAKVLSIDAKYLQATDDPSSIKAGVDLQIAALPKSIKTDPSAVANTITALNKSASQPVNVDLSKAVNDTYVDQAGA
jgi:NitT/TauT family transport system substrate-binding protein